MVQNYKLQRLSILKRNINNSIIELQEILSCLVDKSQKREYISCLEGDYDTSWGIYLKVQYILSKINHSLLLSEIISHINYLEFRYLGEGEKASSISSIISNAFYHKKCFKKYKPYDNGKYLYGLSEWFDGDNIKDEYCGYLISKKSNTE